MPLSDTAIAGRRGVLSGARCLLAAGLAVALAGCNTTAKETTASIPIDYRQRHPISIVDGKRSLQLLVGQGRGGLSPTQRAEVLAFAQSWKREATGGITIERPEGGPNERAANDTLKEVLSIVVSSGIPNHGVGIRPYPSAGSAPLRLNYPVMTAQAGPCGLWPQDLGPTYDLEHYENKPYWNLGCSQQRNLAAMVAEPHDLIQPRAEGSTYRAKRTFGHEKWRTGQSPATTYPDSQKGAISDLGK
jgi:pilus assembly protein CpaD